MNWTDDPVFLPKYAERLRMGNVRVIQTPRMAGSLTKVFDQLKGMGAHRAIEARIPRRLTPAQRHSVRAQIRRALQRSIAMLDQK